MPPRIVPILNRLRQDIAADLATDTIEEACRQTNHSWRKRLLDPATTVYLFLLQILHGNTACQHVVHFGGWSFTDSAYCQARKRLPLAAFHWLLEKTAATFRSATAEGSRWLGHRVWLVDGSSSSMPDAPELQRHFGQPGGQRQGCGFPVAKWLALFDLTTGMLLRTATASLRSHEMSQSAAISQGLEPGDLVLGDRGSCSSAHLALVIQRELHAVFRIPQKQIVDFTPGRPQARRGSKDLPGLPHSRWVLALGDSDQVVVWSKPKGKPSWMTAQESAALPGELPEVAGGAQFQTHKDRHENGRPSLCDGGGGVEGTGGVRAGVQPGAVGDGGVGAVAGRGSGSGRLGRRGAVVDRCGGGRRVGVGGQPVASRSCRASGGEAPAEGIQAHDEAPICSPEGARGKTVQRAC